MDNSRYFTNDTHRLSRRTILGAAGAVGAAAAMGAGLSPAVAAALNLTPRQPLGPFYMPRKPLSVDNDLVLAPGRSQPADGQVIHVVGRLLDPDGKPIRHARVEIWQANTYGRYNHPRDTKTQLKQDPNFQGVGHDETDEEGGYRFRTIKPGAYPNSPNWTRPPHIHFLVKPRDSEAWVSQMYFANEPLNEKDFLLNQVRSADAQARLIRPLLDPVGDMEKASKRIPFDIVLGTPGTEPS